MPATVESMIAARDRPAVQRVKLLNFRQRYPSGLIFAFEGDDDKQVYRQWITRIGPGLSYEPLPLGGKRQVLALYETTKLDVDGIGRDVFFFIDRDFDDGQGIELDGTVFMTDLYSIENYLVCVDTLDKILIDNLHLHGVPAVRKIVRDNFLIALHLFSDITYEVNFRIFCFRRLGINTSELPKQINRIASVSLKEVGPGTHLASECVVAEREPSEEEVNQLRPIFDGLDPIKRRRGKFFYKFFQRWLECLACERLHPRTNWFDGADPVENVNRSFISISVLASISPVPDALFTFIESILRNRQL